MAAATKTKKKEEDAAPEGTFPRLDDPEIIKRHFAVLDAYKQSITSGTPDSLENLVAELSV